MIQSIWILSVLYRISKYFLFFENYFHYKIYAIILISLQRIAGPSRCLLFVYFIIHLSFLGPINRDYSWLLFDYIPYSTNNAGRCCVVVIYRHKCKCGALIIILHLLFLSLWVTMYPNVVYCLHIYNAFFVLKTDKPRLFTVVILFHHIFYQQ